MVSRRVLLIPGQGNLSQQIELILRFLGYDVELAHTPDAIAQIAVTDFGVIFLALADYGDSITAALTKIDRRIPLVLIHTGQDESTLQIGRAHV